MAPRSICVEIYNYCPEDLAIGVPGHGLRLAGHQQLLDAMCSYGLLIPFQPVHAALLYFAQRLIDPRASDTCWPLWRWQHHLNIKSHMKLLGTSLLAFASALNCRGLALLDPCCIPCTRPSKGFLRQDQQWTLEVGTVEGHRG